MKRRLSVREEQYTTHELIIEGTPENIDKVLNSVKLNQTYDNLINELKSSTEIQLVYSERGFPQSMGLCTLMNFLRTHKDK